MTLLALFIVIWFGIIITIRVIYGNVISALSLLIFAVAVTFLVWRLVPHGLIN